MSKSSPNLTVRVGCHIVYETSAPTPILLGRHLLALGLKPGPRVGEILKTVYERQMDGTVTNLDEAIAAATRLL